MAGKYVPIKIPKELSDKIDYFVGKYGFRSKAEFAKEAIRSQLLVYVRLEIANTDFQLQTEGN